MEELAAKMNLVRWASPSTMFCGLRSHHCDKTPNKNQLKGETTCFGSEYRVHSGREYMGRENRLPSVIQKLAHISAN